MTTQATLPGVQPEEARRNKQVNVKLGDVEHAKLQQAAAGAGKELAVWCRETLLQAAGGERAGTHVEVPLGDLSALQRAVENAVTIGVANLAVFLEHVWHGDPTKGHEDDEIARKARRRSAAQMAKLMPKLGLNGLADSINKKLDGGGP